MRKHTIITEEIVNEARKLQQNGLNEFQISIRMQISRSAVDRALSGAVNTPKKCGWCGTEFISARNTQNYCCDSCRCAANMAKLRGSTTRKPPRRRATCQICGETILQGYKYCYDCNRKLDGNSFDIDDIFEKEKPSNHPAISQLAREARNNGMTYGEYVRFIEAKK